MHRSERRSLPLRLGWSTNAVLNYSAERAPIITTVRWIADFSLPAVSSRRRCVTLFYTGADDVEVTSWMRARAKAPSEQIAARSRRFRANPLWRLLEFEDWLHKMWQRRGQI